MSRTTQNEFGYYGKLPTHGDFIRQVLPGDFVRGFHEWLRSSMTAARERLGDGFLAYYLNCPAWKFLICPGVCGEQGITGVTIPSVDRVGRYFNFTLATVLPEDADPISYVKGNRKGFRSLERLAIDILESDFPREELDRQVQAVTREFDPVPVYRCTIDGSASHIYLEMDSSLPFGEQSSALLSNLLRDALGDFSIWWRGQEGQTQSNMVICRGMPAVADYMRLLTRERFSPVDEGEPDIIDQIIAEERGTGIPG